MTVLFVGHQHEGSACVRVAAERTGHRAAFVDTVEAAHAALLRTTPRAVIASSSVDIRELNRTLRARAECFGVPLIALTDFGLVRVFTELYLLGADDVVSARDVGGLTRRLGAGGDSSRET